MEIYENGFTSEDICVSVLYDVLDAYRNAKYPVFSDSKVEDDKEIKKRVDALTVILKDFGAI